MKREITFALMLLCSVASAQWKTVEGDEAERLFSGLQGVQETRDVKEGGTEITRASDALICREHYSYNVDLGPPRDGYNSRGEYRPERPWFSCEVYVERDPCRAKESRDEADCR